MGWCKNMHVIEFENKPKKLKHINDVAHDVITVAMGVSKPTYAIAEPGKNKLSQNQEQITVLSRTVDINPKGLYGVDKAILDRFTERQRELIKNPESTDYIILALDKMESDFKYKMDSMCLIP